MLKRCAITDGTAGHRPGWIIARCEQLAAQGVDLIIVRERALESAGLAHLTRRIVAIAGQARVLVAGSARLALAAGAAGVHLSCHADQPSPAKVRATFPGALITKSCHTLQEVRLAREQNADAVLFGPVFGKWVGSAQVVRGIGLEALAAAVAEAGEMPVYALGGITEANAQQCAAAAGIAAIRLFFS